jgi:hypothetical protein
MIVRKNGMGALYTRWTFDAVRFTSKNFDVLTRLAPYLDKRRELLIQPMLNPLAVPAAGANSQSGIRPLKDLGPLLLRSAGAACQ